jgi:hypothetical protein
MTDIVERLRADAERLDWLNTHGWATLLESMRFKTDVRKAIDAAKEAK